MTLCSNGQKPTIEWQYSGEDEQRIIGADNYTIKQEQGKCDTNYHAFGTFYSKNFSAGGCNKTAYWRTSYSLKGFDVISYQPILSGSQWVIELKNGRFAPLTHMPDWAYESNFFYDDYYGQIVYADALSSCFNTSNPGYGLDFSVKKILRIDGLPDNCGGCVFTVTKNGQSVYQETRPICPTVTHFCDEQCPPDTCQCDCGSEVCCYDTKTGKAVKSFRK